MEATNSEKKQSRDQIALEIIEHRQDEYLTGSIRAKLEAISYPCSIFHIPIEFLNQGRNDFYHPKMVSIGPFHHGKTRLLHMEHHKWDYLNALLSRQLTLDSTLDKCVEELKLLEPKIRACYQGNLPFQTDELLKIILVDACFIIELFLRYSIRGLRRRDDPLFRSPQKFHILRNDLSLLENQIPFFVLQRIYCLVSLPKEWERLSVSELSLKFFKPMIPTDVQLILEKYSFEGSSHLLDLIWKSYLPSFSKIPMSEGSGSGRNLLSASKLKELQIKVKATEAESILDVKFIKGVLIIPSLNIHNYMEALFGNFIAMEHCHVGKMKHISSYVFLMKGLIQSEKDVNLFFKRGIFINYIGQKEDIVNMYNNLCQHINLDRFYYEGMWEQLMGYTTTRWDVLQYNFICKILKTQRGVLFKVTFKVLLLIFLLIGIMIIVLVLFITRHHR
ncbi:unnamed protein product [Amaranthus hypochondriacus]